MRIAHIITRLIIGGAQENTLLSCEGLQRRGHDVMLMTGPTTGPEGSLVACAKAGEYAHAEIPQLSRAVNPWHARPNGGHAPQDARLARVRMNHVGREVAQEDDKFAERPAIRRAAATTSP